MSVPTRSRHLLVELHGCPAELLDSVDVVRESLQRAAAAAGAVVLSVQTHRYAPQGIAGIAVLAESHASVHTWPEASYAAVDVYTCGDSCDPVLALPVLQELLGATRLTAAVVHRGHDAPLSLEPVAVRLERAEGA